MSAAYVRIPFRNHVPLFPSKTSHVAAAKHMGKSKSFVPGFNDKETKTVDDLTRRDSIAKCSLKLMLRKELLDNKRKEKHQD